MFYILLASLLFFMGYGPVFLVNLDDFLWRVLERGLDLPVPSFLFITFFMGAELFSYAV